MGDFLVCVICKKSEGKLVLFSDDTLKKCKSVLKQRKTHNLKYKDITLPNEYLEGGYHRDCYKCFTSLMKKYVSDKSSDTSLNKTNTEWVLPESTHSSNLESTDPTNSCSMEIGESEEKPKILEPLVLGVEKDNSDVIDTHMCLFCKRKKKKVRSKIIPSLHETDKDHFISVIVPILEGKEEFYQFVNNLQSVAGPKVYYHTECRVTFNNKINALTKPSVKNKWHFHRECNQKAFDEICNIIEEDVILKGRCYLLTRLHELYTGSLGQIYEENSIEMESNFTPHHLEEKIMSLFSEKSHFFTFRNKRILAPKYLRTIDDKIFEQLQSANILHQAALILRKAVLEVDQKKLPTKNVSAQHLITGEAVIPHQLTDFYLTLLGGNNPKRKSSQKCNRQVSSYCQDVIYGVHNGKVKTSKHIMLGMTLKSLTSSRKVVDIINRYGHCISYHGVEELETEVTYASIEKSTLCPEKIKKGPGLFTGLAYDNFDRFVETSSGKDTLHDTVGIIYQNIDFNESEESGTCEELLAVSEAQFQLSNSPERKRKRRTFEALASEEIPYPKKPKMTAKLSGTTDELENILPKKLELYREIDSVWMISHALELPDIPMWVGFNSCIYQSDTTQQHISYLAPINASPTNNSVVLETMVQSKKIAEELDQPHIQVTYDLAIAKVALQIQATEKPEFDNLFIHLGPFHIIMAYFKAVGKIISDCGLTNVMVESGLLANGSVNGFLDGKHFNRCRRLHPLVSLGLEILLFKSFLQYSSRSFTDDMIEDLQRLQNCKDTSFQIENEELKELINDYSIFKQQCRNGDFGKTQQFYMIYINLVHDYLNLSRSIRTGDFELFKSVLPRITNLFFICNQQNYARWTVKYFDNLMKVEETHPDLYEGFKQGFFSIKRTNKPFSSQPIDLVLEQTINADAARKLTGVVHFTNSISARQRWARNHDVRSTVISQVYQELGLQSNSDISADMNPHNIKKNIRQLHEFIGSFDQFINPFSSEVPKDKLVNISSGKAASEQVESFLLNIEQNGDCLRKTFISECQTDINRFEKSIKRTPMNNISIDYEKKKNIQVGGKIQEIKIQRDLFGRMLGISMDYEVDIAKILSYPITTVPLSMCHLDGTICKTVKSSLMKCLENEVDHESPTSIDVLIVDGFFLLHTMRDVPKKFGSISKKFLQMVTQSQASRIDVIFDQYFSPSIKDYEHAKRLESAQLMYTITGPDQVRPSDFAKELKNSNFKQALVNFFILHWATDDVVPFIRNKVIHINFQQCHSFVLNDSNKIDSMVVEDLSCPAHEEADTKIIYHVCSITDSANIVIRTVDTDIIAIMLGHMHNVPENSRVWMLVGTGNTLRHIDLSKIYKKRGEYFCKSLPGFHAITGCDYNPAFFRKGKSRPYKLLTQSEEYQKAFIKFGDSNLLEDDDEQENTFDTIQKFMCQVYNVNDVIDVNAARFQLFMTTYSVSNINEVFDRKKLRNFDATNLPPCKTELFQQFLRANYIASIWNNAHLKVPSLCRPEDNGWVQEDNQYHFKWFEGDQLPNFVSDSLETVSEISEEVDQTLYWSCSEDEDYNEQNQ